MSSNRRSASRIRSQAQGKKSGKSGRAQSRQRARTSRPKLLGELGAILVIAYQSGISPLIHMLAGPGFGCRFQPTCSEYAKSALREHGLIHGSWLAVRRISKCQPFYREAA
ncbi:MAG: membrane protein insertion efficiency factor YidD [Bacteriovoracia bacterium]